VRIACSNEAEGHAGNKVVTGRIIQVGLLSAERLDKKCPGVRFRKRLLGVCQDQSLAFQVGGWAWLTTLSWKKNL
jgi:hypothetical protein